MHLKRISEKHESEDVLICVLNFVFFSLIFTYFLPNQRKTDSNNGNLFVSFPMTVIVFQEKRAKKRPRSMGVRHLGRSRYFEGVEKMWPLKIHLKSFRNFPCFWKNMSSLLKIRSFSPMFVLDFVFWIFSKIKVTDGCHRCSLEASCIGSEKGIWQDYHASAPWKINMDAQI